MKTESSQFNPNYVSVPVGVVAGSAAASVATLAQIGASIPISKKMLSQSDDTMTGDAFSKALNLAKKMIGEKDFDLIKFSNCGWDKENFLKELKELTKNKHIINKPIDKILFFYKKISDFLLARPPITKKMMMNNAFYHSIADLIYISPDLQLSVFHEIGHRQNIKGGFLSKLSFRMKLLSELAVLPTLMLSAIFYNDKNKKDTPLNRSMSFIKNNIGTLASATFIPTLIEEARASSKAVKFINAQKELTQEFKKEHSKFLKIAYSTYILGAVLTGVAAKTSVKVKDAVSNYINKKMTKKPDVTIVKAEPTPAAPVKLADKSSFEALLSTKRAQYGL